MSFILLKVRSTVAVVNGSTIKMAANLARLGKEVAIVGGGGKLGSLGGKLPLCPPPHWIEP